MTNTPSTAQSSVTENERDYLNANFIAFLNVVLNVAERAGCTKQVEPTAVAMFNWRKKLHTFPSDDMRLIQAYLETSRAAVGLLSANAIIAAIASSSDPKQIDIDSLTALRQHGNGPVLMALMYDLVPMVAMTVKGDIEAGQEHATLADPGYVASVVFPSLVNLFFGAIGHYAHMDENGVGTSPSDPDIKALQLISLLGAHAMPHEWMAARLAAARATSAVEVRDETALAAFDAVLAGLNETATKMAAAFEASPKRGEINKLTADVITEFIAQA